MLGSRLRLLGAVAARRLCSSTVAIDVSRLPKRTPHAHVEHAPNTLLKALATQMRVRGPMSVKEFMTAALTHPVHGYYMQRSEVIGRQGDFVTSPEVSQVFGELLGIWCVASWQALGQPAQIRLIEMGPGKGTLTADVLRSTAIFAPFQAALRVDLVEVSAHLRETQRETLRAVAQPIPAATTPTSDGATAANPSTLPPPLQWTATSTGAPIEVHWHNSLEDVPRVADVPELVIGHEFLDALPVHQLVQTERGWLERMVDLSEHAELVGQAEADGAATGDGAGGSTADGAGGGAGAGAGAGAGSGAGGGSGGGAGGGAGRDAEWRDLDTDERALDFVLSPVPTPASVLFGARLSARQGAGGDGGDGGTSTAASDGAHGESTGGSDDVASVMGAVEVCPGGISFMQQLCKRLVAQRGAALLIDYGGEDVPRDSLRGILGHRAVHPLHAPGEVDLSVDVDFGAMRHVAADEGAGTLRCPPLVSQRDFLAAMGLEARINALLQTMPDDRDGRRKLVESASRLVSSPGMGTAYKVFAIAHGDVGAAGVAGFGDAPLLDANSMEGQDGGGGAARADDEDLPDPTAGRQPIRKVSKPIGRS